MPIVLWDERLSTAAVTRTLIEGDASRRRRAEVVDKMAAGYMLQGALDALKERERGMSAAIGELIPVFLIIMIGWAARASNIIPPKASGTSIASAISCSIPHSCSR